VVLGEEGGGADRPPGALRWVVDPLDGTTNFLFGIPQWCVSIACEDGEGPLAGAVFDPGRDELFTASRGGGAELNGRRLTASSQGDLGQALVGTGFAYASEVRAGQAQVLTRLLPRIRDLRRSGSAALDLAWTATGRHDAYFERALQPWDRAAGELLCACAGLTLVELPERGPSEPAGLLVAPAAIADELLALVAPSM
jgi:myo-inositol-1(or 4)-monophosphatase